MRFCNHNDVTWMQIEPWDRALCVAQYRMHYVIEAHVAYESKKAAEAEANRG